MSIVKPWAIKGRPLDGGGMQMSVCPICPCPPPHLDTCELRLLYLEYLHEKLGGELLKEGYVFLKWKTAHEPLYDAFLGALQFTHGERQYLAYVRCNCDFVVKALGKKQYAKEYEDACECPPEIAIEMLHDRYGGTPLAEGYVFFGWLESLMPDYDVFRSALQFSTEDGERIAYVDCDCRRLKLAVLQEGQIAKERENACECPPEVAIDMLYERFGGLLLGYGYIFFGWLESLMPDYDVFRMAIQFTYEDRELLAYVDCGCEGLKVAAMQEGQFAKEYEEACECPPEVAIDLLYERYGGVLLDEGAILYGWTDDMTPDYGTFRSALRFSVDDAEYIAHVDCGCIRLIITPVDDNVHAVEIEEACERECPHDVALELLADKYGGELLGEGYVVLDWREELDPVFVVFRSAFVFARNDRNYGAYVDCDCIRLYVEELSEKAFANELDGVCKCPPDALIDILDKKYGVESFGEGFYVENIDPAPSGTPHSGAHIVTTEENRYIALRHCDIPEGECVSWFFELMPEGAYYREMAGVCECPPIIDFALGAEANGYEVFGESILIASNTHDGISHIRASACYFDPDLTPMGGGKGGWRYMGCDCSTSTTGNAFVRFDFGCDECFDPRDWMSKLPGFVGESMGSHTCYKWTNAVGMEVRIAAHTGITTGINNGGGEVDFRVHVSIIENPAGGRTLVMLWPRNDGTIRAETKGVASDAVIDGHAKLLRYWRSYDGVSAPDGIGDGSTVGGKAYNDVGIPGDTYVAIIGISYYGGIITDNYAEALAESEKIYGMGAHAVSCARNYYQMEHELRDKRTPSCDDFTLQPGSIYGPDHSGFYNAMGGWYKGVVYCLRCLRTNKGFLMLDGTFVNSITLPTLGDLGLCGAEADWMYGHSRWERQEGATISIPAEDAVDPICPQDNNEDNNEEIDPEEFE
jgi:hypothetical protein